MVKGLGCFKCSACAFRLYSIMADYGLKVWDSAGTLILDLTDTITRLRYSGEVAAGVDGSIVLSDINGKSTVEIGVALEDEKLPHFVSRSGTTISWTAKSNPYYDSSNSLVLVFLYT